MLYDDKIETAWNVYMQWVYLVGQGTVPTKVFFRCAALHGSARGYNARTYSQTKSDVSLQSNPETLRHLKNLLDKNVIITEVIFQLNE